MPLQCLVACYFMARTTRSFRPPWWVGNFSAMNLGSPRWVRRWGYQTHWWKVGLFCRKGAGNFISLKWLEQKARPECTGTLRMLSNIAGWKKMDPGLSRCISYQQMGIFYCYVSFPEGTFWGRKNTSLVFFQWMDILKLEDSKEWDLGNL